MAPDEFFFEYKERTNIMIKELEEKNEILVKELKKSSKKINDLKEENQSLKNENACLKKELNSKLSLGK